jgi:hypothetical protein
MLVYANSGPLAAIASRPDPLTQSAEIAALVKAGLVVRTQADGDNPLAIDQRRRAAAASSGAQIVSANDDAFLLAPATSFRCDPVLPSPCRSGDLER